MKNDAPRYLLIVFNQTESKQAAQDEDVLAVSARLIGKKREAQELAR